MDRLLPPLPIYVAGLDLGQSQDPTALIVASTQITPNATYDIGHIERMPLGTRYPEVVTRACDVVDFLRRPDEYDRIPDMHLIVDYTGVGRPVADMLIAANPRCTLTLITITGGDTVTPDPRGGWRVPKRDLASSVQVLLQDTRLRFSRKLPLASELKRELTGFRVKISATGHDSYAAGDDWRSAPHDDLVLALAMLCWFGETRLLRGDLVAFSGDGTEDGEWD